MRCPVDNENAGHGDGGGVEIDYCPKCRGVWLDRGELDKIIERAAGDLAPAPASAPARPPSAGCPGLQQEPQRAPQYRDDDRRRHRDYDDDDDYKYGYGKKRKKSILGEIFDF